MLQRERIFSGLPLEYTTIPLSVSTAVVMFLVSEEKG